MTSTTSRLPIDEQDIRFILFDYLNVPELCDRDAFADANRDDAELILQEAWKFARTKVWPTNVVADREGCHYKDGEVTLPKELKQLYKEFVAAGWHTLTSSETYGGSNMPSSFAIGAAEALVSGNMSFSPYAGLTRGVARVVESFGSDWLKSTFIAKLNSGQWSGTMCLTEPHAGTAVGDLRTTAIPNGESYKIRGNKIFITGGDHDLTEQIVHLVLARTKDAPAGIKGVSLFIVPKWKISRAGKRTDVRNDVQCTGIEHKMGFHGSSTCALSFGENDDCEGYLLGEESHGIKYMFQLMNEARIGTGLHGQSGAALAYQLALAYAQDRIQGTAIEDLRNVDARRVPIAEHPDVKRMLFTMKARVHGMRALLTKTAFFSDDSRSNPDEKARERSLKLLDLLTPVCKSHCSDVGFAVAIMAVQTCGGAGYLRDYPIEQVARDVKVASIYEGANGIQALDLIGRKLAKNRGELFFLLMEEIKETTKRSASHPVLADLSPLLDEARTDIERVMAKIAALGMGGEVQVAALDASHFLTMLAQLTTAWLLIDHAFVAWDRLNQLIIDRDIRTPDERDKLLDSDEEAAFLHSKLHVARFYTKSLLPENLALARIIESGDDSILEARL